MRYPGMPMVIVAAALAAAPLCAAETQGQGPILTVGPAGRLLRDGRPWRGVGVNYFDLFARTLRDPDDVSCRDGLKILAERGIPFARFMCGGFWPVEWRLYREDRQVYFRRLDAVVAAAELAGVGLVPSLFWHMPTVPDLVGEPCSAWGDPASETHRFMRAYVREVVTRYRDRPAVWAWEFGNEYNLKADLPNAARHRPKVVPQLGTPAARSERDDLTRAMVRTACRAFAREVRRYDPRRPVTTGSSILRPSAWHQAREGSWTRDTPEQFAEVLLADHPDPVNLISVHCYGENVDRMEAAARAARTAGKPLFVGEFGVAGAPAPDARRRFDHILAELDRCRVPMAALWVFDFPRQAQEWNVTATNARAWQLDRIAEVNARWRGDAR